MKVGFLFVALLFIVLGYLVFRLYEKPEVVIIREVDNTWMPWEYGNWYGGPGTYWGTGYGSIRPTHRPLPRPHMTHPPHIGPSPPHIGPSPPHIGPSPAPHFTPHSPSGPSGSHRSPRTPH
jgi:hypothetical protein